MFGRLLPRDGNISTNDLRSLEKAGEEEFKK